MRCLLIGLLIYGVGLGVSSPTWAAVDPYVFRYLQARDSVSLTFDQEGQTRSFSPDQLSAGKRFFEQNCMNCHVGGTTLPNPTASLSLKALSAATPARNTIASLVDYMRHPTTYDGSEDSLWCREIPPRWLPAKDLENLAAFILRAAEKAPGWGTDTFE